MDRSKESHGRCRDGGNKERKRVDRRSESSITRERKKEREREIVREGEREIDSERERETEREREIERERDSVKNCLTLSHENKMSEEEVTVVFT